MLALLDHLARETDAFTAVLREADLATPVAHCPGWDLAELAAHLAGTHRWAANAVAGDLRRDETPPLPDRAAVVGHYRRSADRLLDVLRATPPDASCPTFLGPRPSAWWRRRQAHETAVHRWDAEHATGRAPVLDEQLSADGVDEVLQVFVPRMRERGLLGELPSAVALEHPAGRVVVGDGPIVATVRADAATLLLVLWQRLPVDVLDGDVAAARPVLEQRLTP